MVGDSDACREGGSKHNQRQPIHRAQDVSCR